MAEETDAIIVDRQADDVISSRVKNGEYGAVNASTMTLEQPGTTTALKDATCEAVKQGIIPSYVKSVAFKVTSDDLNPERQKDLSDRFPGVSIVTDTSPVEAQLAADQWLQQNFNEQVAPTKSTPTATTKPPELKTIVKAVGRRSCPDDASTDTDNGCNNHPYRAEKRTQSSGANDLWLDWLDWLDGVALRERSVSHFTGIIREVADIAYRSRHRTDDPNSRERFMLCGCNGRITSR